MLDFRVEAFQIMKDLQQNRGVFLLECFVDMGCVPGIFQTPFGEFMSLQTSFQLVTPRKTNMAPENGWLEGEFPFWKAYFQGLC